ncbi:MAG: heavy-metal-associated domain-containing protein [Candidatus Anammoxibacter sp.]
MIIRQKKNLLILTTVTLILVIFIKLVSAEPIKIQVKIDGLSCPFCVYGLEKKLKRVEGVEDLKLQFDIGVAEIKIKDGKSIDIDGIRKAVKDGGFTPRDMVVTIKGKIEEVDGRMILRIGDITDSFILKDNKMLREMITSGKVQGKIVTLTGLVQEEKIKGHGLHPHVLEIRKFKFE